MLIDQISIKDIKFSTIIGVYDWERETPQNLHLDLSFPTDAHAIAQTDDIAQAIDYEKVLNCILGVVKNQQFKLIESLANKIAEQLLLEFPMQWINLHLHKPKALLNAKDVSISIVRRRE